VSSRGNDRGMSAESNPDTLFGFYYRFCLVSGDETDPNCFRMGSCGESPAIGARVAQKYRLEAYATLYAERANVAYASCVSGREEWYEVCLQAARNYRTLRIKA
jgi:hypothetical protein